MIPFMLPETGPPSGTGTPKKEAATEDAVIALFGDLMVVADDATDPLAFKLADGEAVPPVEPDVVLPEAAAPDQDVLVDEEGVLPPLKPEVSKEGQQRAELGGVGPLTKATGPLVQSEKVPAARFVPSTGAPPQPPGIERAVQNPVEPQPQRPTVAQSVVEGRLPQVALPEVVATRISENGLKNMAANDAPPRAGELPTVPGRTPPAFDTAAVPKAMTAALPLEARALRLDEPRQTAVRESLPNAAAPTQVPAQPPAVALAQTTARPLHEAVEASIKSIDGDAPLVTGQSDRHVPVTTTQVSASAPPAETARHAAAQIAVAISNTSGKVTEISLNPEELGRVRLSLSAADGVISLNVLAERPETHDLLRRHMDILAQEFRQLGYTSISFSFGEQKGQARPDASAPDSTQEPEIEAPMQMPEVLPNQPSTGLDLRI